MIEKFRKIMMSRPRKSKGSNYSSFKDPFIWTQVCSIALVDCLLSVEYDLKEFKMLTSNIYT